MDNRHSVRYNSELLPKKLTTTTISLPGDVVVESRVINYCALGMKVIIPPASVPPVPPKKNDAVKVLLPVAADEPTWFAGTCVHAVTEPDGSFAMGIYFCDPIEQDHLYTLLFSSLNEPLKMPSFISHEWEELVAKLCALDDLEIRKIGNREMDIIKTHRKGNCFRPSCAASADCFFMPR